MNLARLRARVPSWTSVGYLLMLILALYALYLQIHGADPHITYDITSAANVLDVRKSVNNLTITYGKENIQETNRNLRIVTVRVTNDGGKDIVQADYDSADGWGIRVRHGDIVEARLSSAGSRYLREKLQPAIDDWNARQARLFATGPPDPANDTTGASFSEDEATHDPSTIPFPRAIFDRGDYLTLELLVLHKADVSPEFIPVGKIAGIRRLTLTDSSDRKRGSSFWRDVIYGSVGVHLVRLLLYVIAAVAVGAFSAGLASLGDYLGRKRREARIVGVIKQNNLPLTPEVQYLKICYVRDGIEGLQRTAGLLRRKKDLSRAVRKWKTVHSREAHVGGRVAHSDAIAAYETELMAHPAGHMQRTYWSFRQQLLGTELAAAGLVRLTNDGEVEIAPALPEALQNLIRLLE